MLANTPRSDTSFAWLGNRAVRLAAGTRCPCGRELHATDVTVDESATKLICIGCHRDVLVIEASDPDNEEAVS